MIEKIKKEVKDFRERIKKVKWWHSFILGNYGFTNGKQKGSLSIHMPKDLTGKTVLDIGAVDGQYSFEAESRGAKRVLAVDSYAWQKKQYSSYKDLDTGKDGFNLAREILKSKVEDLELTDFDEQINVETLGKWDIVLYLGILYHMKDPFRQIRKLYEITNELLIIETHTDANDAYAWNATQTPKMAFYPHDELNHDETNWWGPNISCIRYMLKCAGFKSSEVKYLSSAGRMVIHAWKNKREKEV